MTVVKQNNVLIKAVKLSLEYHFAILLMHNLIKAVILCKYACFISLGLEVRLQLFEC